MNIKGAGIRDWKNGIFVYILLPIPWRRTPPSMSASFKKHPLRRNEPMNFSNLKHYNVYQYRHVYKDMNAQVSTVYSCIDKNNFVFFQKVLKLDFKTTLNKKNIIQLYNVQIIQTRKGKSLNFVEINLNLTHTHTILVEFDFFYLHLRVWSYIYACIDKEDQVISVEGTEFVFSCLKTVLQRYTVSSWLILCLLSRSIWTKPNNTGHYLAFPFNFYK